MSLQIVLSYHEIFIGIIQKLQLEFVKESESKQNELRISVNMK